MLPAKEQPAPILPTIGLASTDITQASVDLLHAAGMIAIRGHPVPDIALPPVVITD